MRRVLIQTLALQGIGVMLMLGATLYVARFGGPDAQGRLALVKSMNDFQVAIFSFGLPSALVYVLNRTGTGHHRAFRLSGRYCLVLLLLLPLIDFAILSLIVPESGESERVHRSLLIGGASALLTCHALQRGLLLVRTDGPLFSVMSILPNVVLLGTLVALLDRYALSMELAYAFAGVIGLATMTAVLGRSLAALPPDCAPALDRALLVGQSRHVFIQASLFAAQAFATNAVLEAADASLATAGLFNVAAMTITLPNLLVALVAPVLFNRWSRSLDWPGYRRVLRHGWRLGLAAQVAAVGSLPLVTPALELGFSPQFAGATAATRILLLALGAVVLGRILTPALQGLGFNRIVTWSCAARIAAMAGVITVGWAGGIALLEAAAAGWAAGEFAALAVLIVGGRSAQANAAAKSSPAP